MMNSTPTECNKLIFQRYLLRDIPHFYIQTLVGEVVGQDRSALYQQGGCFIATSRVIIHDLLRNIIHPSRIRGFLVYNAHKISESSIESFILRVYKNANRDGFVKVNLTSHSLS